MEERRNHDKEISELRQQLQDHLEQHNEDMNVINDMAVTIKEMKLLLEGNPADPSSPGMVAKINKINATFDKGMSFWEFIVLSGKLMIAMGIMAGSWTAISAFIHGHFVAK